MSGEALAFAWRRGRLLVRRGDDGPLLLTFAELTEHFSAISAEAALYFGELHGRACYALDFSGEREEAPAALSWESLRALGGRLDGVSWSVAARATQLLEWDRTHRYCGACGAPTSVRTDERARVCEGCKLQFFPRLSPAIIVLVTDGERALLGRGHAFPEGMYSALAGFVEPGETLEDAIAREVEEETAIQVGHLRYFGSQNWPFPHSLMVGFFADYQSGELSVDTKELADARWFQKDALPLLPPPVSIARQLIEAWRAGKKSR
jgi:NAD+ diphosphatase